VRARTFAAIIAIATGMSIAATPPVGAQQSEPSDSHATPAILDGEIFDLAQSWGEARACVVWASDEIVECFSTEAELVAQTTKGKEHGPPDAESPARASSTCSSPLKLYDGTAYTGSALYLYSRTTWLNLSTYGFANRPSSYKVGACNTYFADDPNGGGSWYPTSLTEAWDLASSMNSGWNNRVSSVFIN
jgi:hypothetical protein